MQTILTIGIGNVGSKLAYLYSKMFLTLKLCIEEKSDINDLILERVTKVIIIVSNKSAFYDYFQYIIDEVYQNHPKIIIIPFVIMMDKDISKIKKLITKCSPFLISNKKIMINNDFNLTNVSIVEYINKIISYRKFINKSKLYSGITCKNFDSFFKTNGGLSACLIYDIYNIKNNKYNLIKYNLKSANKMLIVIQSDNSVDDIVYEYFQKKYRKIEKHFVECYGNDIIKIIAIGLDFPRLT